MLPLNLKMKKSRKEKYIKEYLSEVLLFGEKLKINEKPIKVK